MSVLCGAIGVIAYVIAMNLVSEMLGLIVRLYIRFHRMGSYNVYIINIIDNMHLICNWKGVRKGGKVRGSTARMIQKKILGFTTVVRFLPQL